jgi:hypothetical protein
MQNPPGQGLSKKARQRRNKRATTTTIVTQRNPPQQQQTLVTRTVTKTGRRRGRKGNPNRLGGNPSTYLRSLQDPENGSGARCPDATAVPTGTWQLTADLFATYVESPSGAIRASGIAVTPADMSYSTVTAVGDDGVFTWSAATALPGRTSSSAIYSYLRVVSGCLRHMFTGGTDDDDGIQIAGWTPSCGAQQNQVSTAGTAMSSAYSSIYPVRNGICVLYRPKDNNSFAFHTTGAAPTMSDLAPGLFIVTNGISQDDYAGMWRITLNFEGIAAYDTANFVQPGTQEGNLSAIRDAALRWGQTLSDKIYPLFEANSKVLSNIAQVTAAAGLNYLNNRIMQQPRGSRNRRMIEL